MGNNTSSEAPSKPHKLTKPRVGNHTAATGLSSSSIHSTSKNGRFSNSYVIGPPMPISPIEPSLAGLDPANIDALTREESHQPTVAAARRHSTGRNKVSSSKSLQPRQPVRRSAINAADVKTSSPLETAHTSLQPQPQPDFSRSDLSINSSQPDNGSDKQWNTVNYSLAQVQNQRLLEDQQNAEINMFRSESLKTLQGVTENTWKSSHPHTAPTSPISRTNSEVSLYTPMRRRSIIQTPGLATRAQQTATRTAAKPNFRNSLPPTPIMSRRPSAESIITRRMTMPAGPIDLASIKMRVETPSEADYKQLGGIKFGSLRITNGAPDLTPHAQDGDRSESDKETGYFECKTTASDIEPSEEGKDDNDKQSQQVDMSQCQESTDEKAGEDLSFASRVLGNPSNDPLHLRIEVAKKLVLDSSSARPLLVTTPRHAKDVRKRNFQSNDENVESVKMSTTDPVSMKDGMGAGMNRARYQSELENKAVKTLARSDSGFISSPSSDTSRKTLSKADSGYSSNVSLRSLRSLKPEHSVRSRTSLETQSTGTPERRTSGKSSSSSVPSVTPQRQHYRSKSEIPPPPPPPQEIDMPAIPSRRSSLSSLAHVAIKRIPTLKRSKSRDVASSRNVAASETHKVEKMPSKAKSFTSVSMNSRVHNMDAAHDSSEPTPPAHSIPAEIVDFNHKSRKHKKRSSTVSHRLGPRTQTSKDTLKTILSVGSTDMLQACELAQGTGPQTLTDDKKSQPTTPQKRSLRSLSHSLAQATSNLLHSKQHEVPAPPKLPPKDHSSETKSKPTLKVKVAAPNHSQHRVSQNSPTQMRNVAFLDRNAPKRTIKKVHSVEGKGQKQLSPLRTQRSAPNFTEQEEWPLSPTFPELSHLKNKTTPPVSMRTRTSKSRGPTLPSRSWSAPPVEISVNPRSSVIRNRSQESLASRRSTHSSSHSPHGSLSSIMEVQVNSPQPTSPMTYERTSWHMKPRPRPQTSTSLRKDRPPNTSGSTQELLRNSRTLPGIAIPYPDLRNTRVPTRHRSMSDVQNVSPTWAPKRPSEAQLQELKVLTQQRRQSCNTLPDRSRRHSRHASGDSGRGQLPSSRPASQINRNSGIYRGVAL